MAKRECVCIMGRKFEELTILIERVANIKDGIKSDFKDIKDKTKKLYDEIEVLKNEIDGWKKYKVQIELSLYKMMLLVSVGFITGTLAGKPIINILVGIFTSL